MLQIAKARQFKNFRGRAFLCALLLVISIFVWRQSRSGTVPTIRVGADNAPPYYTIQPDGSVKGLAVDILNEAARRRGVQLRWIGVTDESLDQALSRGHVDLWPAVGSTIERQSRLHFTEPWLQARFCLVSQAGAPVDTALVARGKRVAHVSYPNTIRQAVKFLPGAALVPKASHADVIRAVCLGEAAAAFLDSRILDSVLLHRPRDCEYTDFHVRFLNGASHGLSIVSQRSFASAADGLRAEISRMALDGAFSASLDNWSSFSAAETRSLFALREAEAQTRMHIYAIVLLVFTALLLCWQVVKRKKAERMLENLAQQDSLTGLANRRFYETRLNRAVEEARSALESFALFYIDVDGFKMVNDTLGHSAGDSLLCQISKRLQNVIRPCDHLARIGGDEFTIVTGALPCRDAIRELAQRLLALFDAPFVLTTHEVLVGASIGISLYPDDGLDTATLQLNADSAMYSSKNKGRKRFSFFGATTAAENSTGDRHAALRTCQHSAEVEPAPVES